MCFLCGSHGATLQQQPRYQALFFVTVTGGACVCVRVYATFPYALPGRSDVDQIRGLRAVQLESLWVWALGYRGCRARRGKRTNPLSFKSGRAIAAVYIHSKYNTNGTKTAALQVFAL